VLTDEQVAAFHRDGFVKGGRVLDDQQVDELRAEMERVIEDRDKADRPQPVQLNNMGTDESPVWQIVNIWQASDAYAALIRNPQITEELGQLSGFDQLRIWHDQIQYKPAQTGGTNHWHQDTPLWPVLAPDTQLTAWVALDDVDAENGCMSMVIGSHLWGDEMNYLRTLETGFDLPEEFNGHKIEVSLRPVAKGEVHYHHSLTWHGSHSNTSGRPRRAIALHVMGDDTRYVASGKHIMQSHIDVGDGEKLEGQTFPVVFSRTG
jgi:phytanoyl-CoA hydroxylase